MKQKKYIKKIKSSFNKENKYNNYKKTYKELIL